MANYGPPGGGAPEPWGGRRPDDTYGAPPEPRRGEAAPGQPQPPYGVQQPYAQSAFLPAGSFEPVTPYRPAGPEAYPGAPRPRRRRGPLIALAAVLAVVLLGGAGVLAYLLGRDDDPAPVAGTSAPTAGASVGAPAPVEPAPTTPAPASSSDPRFVKAGQCVRNEGTTGGKPKLVISDCAPKAYEVLRRFDGATSGEKDAEAKCAKVADYTNWYFFDSELDTLDFVLCLRQR